MSLTTGVCVQQVRQPALRELTSSAAHQCFQETSTPSWGVCVQGFPCTAFGRHHQSEQEIPQRTQVNPGPGIVLFLKSHPAMYVWSRWETEHLSWYDR